MTMLPERTYKARAIDWGHDKSTQKGTPYAWVVFGITDGEYKGREVNWNGYMTEKTMQRTVQSLKSCGCIFPEDNIYDLMGCDTNEVNIVVKHESYQKEGMTKTVARVAFVNGRVREKKKVEENADTRAIKAKAAVLIRAAKAGTKQDDTDLPF